MNSGTQTKPTPKLRTNLAVDVNISYVIVCGAQV